MKKRKITALLMATLMIIGVIPAHAPYLAAGAMTNDTEYAYFEEPISLPYQEITDSDTGRTYKHIDLFGNDMLRGYLDVQSWLPDGSGFICGTAEGHLYLYDIQTQMLTYLDKIIAQPGYLAAVTCLNGWIYYVKSQGNVYTIWRIHPESLEKEEMFTFPAGVSMGFISVTNDGRYASIEVYDYDYVLERPENTTPIIRVDLEEKKMEYKWYSFSYASDKYSVDHFQINPEYPNLIAFSHDYAEGYTTYDIYDRLNIMDITTGDVITYNSGRLSDGRTAEMVTHEVWGATGEHRWFSCWATDPATHTGALPAVVRIDKDGTHRQYYETNGANAVHANVSGDEKMICTDFNIRLISTQTHQVFPIVDLTDNVGDRNHPYHPHPHLSHSGDMVSWGEERDGVLGISFMNYTDILENEVAKGGRESFGEDVTRVSYEGIECESSITKISDKECVTAEPGKSIFFDINPDVTDVDNGAAKITFDYFDNGTEPLAFSYTKGVEEINDAWHIYNRTIEIERNNTQQWKTKEIAINCGNFESIGKFESDFKIESTVENAYIANISVDPFEATWGGAELATEYEGGTGTADDPYRIANAAQLRYANDQINSNAEEAAKSYKLTDDIDFKDGDWVPLGWNLPYAFSGTFDGADHVISNINLTIDADSDVSSYAGFFGKCDSATVKNLGLDNITVSIANHETDGVRYNYIGGMAGGCINTTFERCFVKNSTVKNSNREVAEDYLGGFVGVSENSVNFTNCYVYNTEICAATTAQQSGFAGHVNSTSNVFTNCYAAGVTNGATENIATTYGFGAKDLPITATNCYSTLIDALGSEAYDASKSFGETGMTKEALVSAMVATGAYKVSSIKNDGYPYLPYNSFDGTPATTYAKYPDGSIGTGRAEKPFLIENAAQLLRASQRVSSGYDSNAHFELVADIDYKGYQWEPFGQNGTDVYPFTGGFNGNGHVIKNLVISNNSGETPYKDIGFFGYINSAEVKNLGIENINISAYCNSSAEIETLGGFAGQVYGNSAKISNCYVKNSSVRQKSRWNCEQIGVGAFVGAAREGASFENCYVYDIKVCSGWAKIQTGFVGSLYHSDGANFKNCYSAKVEADYSGTTDTTVTSTTYGFGFTGADGSETGIVSNCYSTLECSTGNYNKNGNTSPAYSATYEFGYSGRSIGTIQSVFEKLDGFAVSNDINGGFPHLSFEVPIETPDYMIKSVKTDVSNGEKIKVDIAKNAEGTAIVYVAGYSTLGRLTDFDFAVIDSDSFTFASDVDTKKSSIIKVFVWNEKQSPLIDDEYKAIVKDNQFIQK